VTVSVVMPYWYRAAALMQSLGLYAKNYSDLDLEIVIVNDGSSEKPAIPAMMPWPVRVIDLPPKQIAKNPCVPINIGVDLAKGDVILLTNPEIMHRQRVIPGMLSELRDAGPKGYIAAACWDEKLNTWLCKSNSRAGGQAKMPEGAGLHFCAVLHREFFREVGGFCCDYREGQGYEDNDFLWALHDKGAVFRICDHLIVDHAPAPRTVWPKGGAERNRRIFETRWGV
jgi:glycosyltransferase involved in cell wall biosynthesis